MIVGPIIPALVTSDDVGKFVWRVGFQRLEELLRLGHPFAFLVNSENVRHPTQTEFSHSQRLGERSFHQFTRHPELTSNVLCRAERLLFQYLRYRVHNVGRGSPGPDDVGRIPPAILVLASPTLHGVLSVRTPPISRNQFPVNSFVAEAFGAVIKDDGPLDDVH